MNKPKNGFTKRRYWIGIVAIALAALLIVSYMPTWAAPAPAPHNQTVPIPTPKPDPTKVPTATPHNDDDDDGGNSGGSDATPVPPSDPIGGPEPETPEGAGDIEAVNGGLAAPASNELFTGEVTVVRLNVRSGPGTGFDIVGTASNGDLVQLLARNDEGTWWALCCVGEAGVPGWVSAQFIKPSGSRTETGNALPIVEDLNELAAIVASDEDDQVAEAATAEATEEQAAGELALTITQFPPNVMQGDPVELRFTVTNTGEQDVTNISLRNQLSDRLTYVSAAADGEGTVSESSGEDDLILRIDWPQLAVGESSSAIVSVTIASDLAAGAVIDNLAAVDADNASSVTNGVSIGMAPITLPDF
jgi:uncharacterized repeat protein (TIGR01451 family)